MWDHRYAQDFYVHHRQLMGLCGELERVADSLPHNVNQQTCIQLANALGPNLIAAQELEEKEIFPALLSLAPCGKELGDTIRQLCQDHQMDRCYAEEVQEMLYSYGVGMLSVSHETAGFMLRGFFESLRRHLAFEDHLVMPLFQPTKSG